MPPDVSPQAAALRQAVLVLAFLVSFVALVISLLRGSDLLHAAFVALWVLPISALVIYHVFRMWFLVLMRSIQEMRARQDQQEPPSPGSTQNQGDGHA